MVFSVSHADASGTLTRRHGKLPFTRVNRIFFGLSNRCSHSHNSRGSQGGRAILVAVLYFHDKFTWVKGLGLYTILSGVSLFNWYKYLKLQKGHFGEGEVAVLHTTDSASKYVILEEMD
ncbi:putative sugar phosphate/phosphate translocator [Arachis hypogaea]|nr:putative sugar phosphate/phosphate translocator [Arachis hypogaea]